MASWLRLEAQYHHRVWGGDHFAAPPGHQAPIGEVWLVHQDNRVTNGPWMGQTLGEVASQLGAELLGTALSPAGGPRFPLLIKLLDCADWLSVQVHPNDQQARAMVGPNQLGKTEAWHILQADAQAQVIAGVRPGTSTDQLAQAIRKGEILDLVQRHPVAPGDTVMMPAGTLHALGPGLLLYEVQQTSDTTYRVFDWNRPASAGRTLHLEESIAVTDSQAHGQVIHPPQPQPHGPFELVRCPYFVLETVRSEGETLKFGPHPDSFHILTSIGGQARLEVADRSLILEPYSTVILPANGGAYRLTPQPQFAVLRSWIPHNRGE